MSKRDKEHGREAWRKRQRKQQERTERQDARRTQRMVLISGVIVLGALIVSTVGAITHQPEPSFAVGSWELPSLRGRNQVALETFRGKPVIMMFYTSSCQTCKGTSTALVDIKKQTGTKVAYVAVNTQESDKSDGKKFAKSQNFYSWPIARDTGGTNNDGLLQAFPGATTGTVIYYDTKGAQIGSSVPPATKAQIATQMKALYKLSIK